ncbi:MAG: hypothetical protein JXA11_11820 [Phycisphaerae bacterium]|nr:hypothetical protein [Phycisphaerae bacterium]
MNRILITSLLCVLSVGSALAERPLLRVDFAKPAWRELFPSQRGNISVAGGAAVLRPGASLNTAMFPYRAGMKVSVSVKSRCHNVKPGKNGWDVCWATITGFGGDKKELCHQDIILVGGTQPWKTYTGTYDFNDQVKYFQVNLSNAGSKGKVWYKDFSISISDPEQAEEMIGDPGFEGTLNADHWYFVRNSKDWDDLDTWARGSEAKHDERNFVVGPRGLHLTGPATVVSKAFPYNGEKLLLSAWMRSKGVKCGKTGWAGAGIQFVGLDKDGKHFAHHDLDILFETQPWRYRTGDYTFPAAVKNVQVWIRQFDGAKGESWFDEVRLARVPLGAQKPFNPKRAKVSVDAAAPGDVIQHRVWAGIDTGVTIGWWKRDEIRQIMPFLVKAGFVQIRNHEFINGTEFYLRDDEKGNPVYDWTLFDSIHDLYKKNGIIPIVTLESTPLPLDKPDARRPDFHNTGAPKDMKKWGRMIEAIFEHAIQRYGKEYVEQWLWEVWNEPGLPNGYYSGSLEEFLALAEQIYLAADRVEKKYGVDLKMGLTSSGTNDIEEPLVAFLQKKNMLGMIDHYSTHIYAGGSSSIRMFEEALKNITRGYEKRYPGLKFKQLGCTEWNCNSMQSPLFDKPWNATFVVKAVRIMLDAGLDYATYFGLADHPDVIPDSEPLFQDSMGLFTRKNLPIPKPGYNGFVFLNELKGGRRLKFTSSNDPIDGLAVLMPDGAVRIVLTSYDEDTARQPYETEVYVQLQGPPDTKYTCTRLWAADEKFGNTHGEWVKMGKPAYTDDAAKRKLQQAIQHGVLTPPEVRPGPDGTIELKVIVPSPGIRFLDIQPVK